MKHCIFCKNILVGGQSGNRAVEHAFPKWLQKRLKITTQEFLSRKVDVPSNSILSEYKFSLNRFVAKQVCANCNNGWMSELETAVAPLFERLFRGYCDISNFTVDEKLNFERWSLKTALAAITAGSSDLQPAPEHFRSALNGSSAPGIHIVVGFTHGAKLTGFYQLPRLMTADPDKSPEMVGSYGLRMLFGTIALLVLCIPIGFELALHAGFYYPITLQPENYRWYKTDQNPEFTDDLRFWQYFSEGVIIVPPSARNYSHLVLRGEITARFIPAPRGKWHPPVALDIETIES